MLYFVTRDEINKIEPKLQDRWKNKIPKLDAGSVAVYGTQKFNDYIINLLGKEFKVAAAEKTDVNKDSYMSSMSVSYTHLRIQEYFSSGLNVEQNSHLLMSLRDF